MNHNHGNGGYHRALSNRARVVNANAGQAYAGRAPIQRRGRISSHHSSRGSHVRMNQPVSGVINPIGYQALEEMATCERIEGKQVTLQLFSEHSGFSQRLRQDMDGGMIQMLLKVIGKMCRDNDPPQCLSSVLITILKSKFSDKIIRFMHELITEKPNIKRQASTHVCNCLDLLHAWVSRIPTTSENEVSMLLTNVKHVVNKMKIGNEKNINSQITEIESILEELEKKYQPVTHNAQVNELQRMHNEAPPDNFREISVFPKDSDINGKDNVYVRTNLVNSAYNSNDHYLDVQFRLLREDFVRPLREGIQYCFTMATDNFALKKQKQQNVKVYENVTIEYPLPGRTGIQYCIHFNPNRLKGIKWETSRRLMYGNLVCLSADKFDKHFLFASIADRDPKQLKMGYVTVEFVSIEGNEQVQAEQRLEDDFEDIDDSDEDEDDDDDEENVLERLAEVSRNGLLSQQDMKKKYYMVETEAYFESYRHVLAGLQKIENIPLERYIVQCKSDLRPPNYIGAATTPVEYDFKCITQKYDSNASTNNTKVKVLQTRNWPSADNLHLDASQVAALKSALTNELSVIQGPPGTGKTHVGLAIMKMLLANRNTRNRNRYWRPRQRNPSSDEHSQILVVCYTNHALDQFLEGISQFHKKGIIRIGGRCKNEKIERFKLNNVRKLHAAGHAVRTNRRTVWQLHRDLDVQKSFISSHTDVLDVSTHSIVKLNQLVRVIPSQLYDQLTQNYQKGDEALLQWLGVADPENIFESKPYLIYETLAAVSKPVVEMGFEYPLVVKAIVETGSLEQRAIVSWLSDNPDIKSDNNVIPSPDVIYSYLEQLNIPFDHEALVAEGFDKLEIKCALLATGFNRLDIQCIRSWLIQQTQSQEEQQLTEEEMQEVIEATAEITIQDDDIEFIEGQRSVDRESDHDDDELANTSKTNDEAKKRAEMEFAAVTYEQIKGNIYTGKWEVQPQERKRRKKRIKEQIGRVDAMSKADAKNVKNVYDLNISDRWRLYRRWIQDLRCNLREQIVSESVKYNELAKALQEAQNEADFAILRTANVIGMTTTGAARYRDIVKRLPAKIVVVEEAAEVLEAHIVTSMPRATEHLLLIGDHQQLRPSPTVYELAKKFNLDISLFERMINNGIPCSKLVMQHRMRPRIADLLRPHIYEDLRDHESVKHYDRIVGIRENIFFLSHEYLEDNVQDGRSKVNQHEAAFMVSLCQYLIQQGYSPDQITILTAYVGQLHILNRLMTQKLRRVRVTAIDNFQGEESDIILLSLVRSNEEGKIGFLSIENRVCVALSRAKMGLFCIGNLRLLKKKSGIWSTILEELGRDGLVGDALPLQCKNHNDRVVMAKTSLDFEKVPEGGCGQRCQFRLPCGHVCTRSCHPDDEMHKLFKCRKPCEKKCERGHQCKLKCHQLCHCTVLVWKVVPTCNHKQKMKCSMDPDKFECKVPCPDTLKCGHKCSGTCGKRCPTQCEVLVNVKPNCGHEEVEIPCHRSDKPLGEDCRAPCVVILKCGHQCAGNCYSCKQGRLHVRCQKKCERVLFCGHVCRERCSAQCPPCTRRCETQCLHSKCGKKCFETCVLCKEKCNKLFWWNKKCTKLCSEPCNQKASNRPCKKWLKCGHQCIGLMGEPCPKLCRICNKKEVTEVFLGNEGQLGARYVQLECGHVFEYGDLDKWMNMGNDEDDSVMSIQLKECPRCKTVIRRSGRYRHIINRQLNLINEVKEKINGNPVDIEGARKRLSEVMNRSTDKKIVQLLKCRENGQGYDIWKTLGVTCNCAKTLSELAVVETQYRNVCGLYEIKYELSKLPLRSKTENLIRQLILEINLMREWLLTKRPYFSEQEKLDFECEFERMMQGKQLIRILDNCASSTLPAHEKKQLNDLLTKVRVLVFGHPQPYSACKGKVESLMSEIKNIAPSAIPGLGITETEREMIVKAMSFRKGHWNKCRNGHVYCIGDCGGANQLGECPECKEAIGGLSYRLAEGNQIASEMDGATAPAYDPNNFYIPDEL